MAVQIQFRRGLASEWTTTNPILAEGEVGVEIDTLQLKIGDGVQEWVDLPYATITSTYVDDAIADHEAALDPHPQYLTETEANGLYDALGAASAAQAFSIQRANHTGTQLASTISDFTEASQDAVGAALTDTASVDLTYNDAGNTISAAVIPSGVDHNALLNYVANRHIDHSAVNINAGTGLTGGGDITATRTISMPNVGTAGTYGSASQVAVITTDAQGRVSAAVNTAISILSSAVIDFAATVRSTLLTGYAVGADTAILATDTVLQAFQKLQVQINARNKNIVTEASKTGTTTTTSTTDVLLDGMSITPVAGRYIVSFHTSLSHGTNNANTWASVYVGGVKVTHSEVQFNRANTTIVVLFTISNVLVEPNGSQAVEIRWRVSAGTGTSNTARHMSLTRVD
jgi:hypothetical protein